MTTKKNKEQFEKWFKIKYPFWFLECNAFNEGEFNYLYDLPLSMQWGVYLEYYDSIEVDITDAFIRSYVICVETKMTEEYTTRQEAQTEALKKADEIVNSRL